MPALPKPTKKRKNDSKIQDPAAYPSVLTEREEHDAGRQRDIEGREDERLASADAVAHPALEESARNGAKAGGY